MHFSQLQCLHKSLSMERMFIPIACLLCLSKVHEMRFHEHHPSHLKSIRTTGLSKLKNHR